MDARSDGPMRGTWQRQALSLLIFGALLFAPAGTLRFWQAWLFGLVFIGSSAALGICFAKHEQNSYAASTIRVEADQPVISTGLYGIVRHPMYVGGLLLMLCTPLALGSFWSLLLLVPSVPVLAWRILDEERVLARDLPGYVDYCQRVRYRLIPGVW